MKATVVGATGRTGLHVLDASDAAWTCLRPPRLVEKPALGHYRIGAGPPAKGRTLTCADLATALLDSIEREDLVQHAAFVAN